MTLKSMKLDKITKGVRVNEEEDWGLIPEALPMYKVREKMRNQLSHDW